MFFHSDKSEACCTSLQQSRAEGLLNFYFCSLRQVRGLLRIIAAEPRRKLNQNLLHVWLNYGLSGVEL